MINRIRCFFQGHKRGKRVSWWFRDALVKVA